MFLSSLTVWSLGERRDGYRWWTKGTLGYWKHPAALGEQQFLFTGQCEQCMLLTKIDRPKFYAGEAKELGILIGDWLPLSSCVIMH